MKQFHLIILALICVILTACGSSDTAKSEGDFDVNRASELIAKFDSDEPFTNEEIAEVAKIYIAAVDKAIAVTNDPDNKTIEDAYEALFQFNTENSSILSLADILKSNSTKLDKATYNKIVMAENRLTETIDKFGNMVQKPEPKVKPTEEGEELLEIVENNEEHIQKFDGPQTDEMSDY